MRMVALGQEEGLTIRHYRFDSDIIDDTPEAILEEVEKYCAIIKHHEHCEIFIRLPLTITHAVEFSGRRVARVYARWSLLKKHEVPTSDGPYGL